jgi:hypothetical protein
MILFNWWIACFVQFLVGSCLARARGAGWSRRNPIKETYSTAGFRPRFWDFRDGYGYAKWPLDDGVQHEQFPFNVGLNVQLAIFQPATFPRPCTTGRACKI